MEIFTYFEDMEDGELFARKNTPKKADQLVPETAEQRSTLFDVTDFIWDSLHILGTATDLESLKLPYLDTKKKQDALVRAMRSTLTKEFLMNHIRLKWPLFVQERRKRQKNSSTKSASQQEAERRFGI